MIKAISLFIMLLVAIEVDGVESYTYVSSENGSAVIMEAPEMSAPQSNRTSRSKQVNNRKGKAATTKTNKNTTVKKNTKPKAKVEAPKVVRVSLEALTGDYTAKDGEVLSGKLGLHKLTIADKATVVLDGVDISSLPERPAYKFAGITCAGDATIILAEGTMNLVKGGYENYPGIYVPEDKTLTIKGPGLLECVSQGWSAGIGGGKDLNCGNIVIEEGTIIAEGGKNAAAIGGGWNTNCGNIVINPSVTSVTIIKHRVGGLGIGAGKDGTCGTVTIAENVQVTEE